MVAGGEAEGSCSRPTALELARRIERGIRHVNGSTDHDEPQMPFGGVKASGFGRFGGKAAIEEFTEYAGSLSSRARGTIRCRRVATPAAHPLGAASR